MTVLGDVNDNFFEANAYNPLIFNQFLTRRFVPADTEREIYNNPANLNLKEQAIQYLTFSRTCLTISVIQTDDAFTQKCISDRKVSQLVKSMIGFKHLMDAFQPLDFMACATSAMREAENGPQICKRILEEADIKVDIIDGKTEAQFIFENKSADMFGGSEAYLYVDIGGGSTEITLFSQGRIITSGSFNIGTIRLLEGLVSKAYWKKMRQWLKDCSAPFTSMVAIGSGGNINKAFRLANCKNGKPLSDNKILKVRRFLKHFTVEQRIRELALRPDRADVIIPALDIYLKIMKWAGIRKIYVPEIGLADGIVHIL